MRSNEVWSILSVFSIIADFRCQPYLKKDKALLLMSKAYDRNIRKAFCPSQKARMELAHWINSVLGGENS
jgi:hypothetical protein